MVTTDDMMVWHNDGHYLVLQINKSVLEITKVHCPWSDVTDGPCRHNDADCVVQWFLTTYGMECNVGVAKPAETLPVAWTFLGEAHKDLATCQVWIIPVDDEAFSAWMVTQS